MSEENLSDLLERAADRRTVGSPPIEQMLSNGRRARKRHSAFVALAASVAVGSVIAGATFVANREGPTPRPIPVDGSVFPSKYPTVVPAGDIATWTLAPNQDLTTGTTAFTVLVTRADCNSGVTGEVRGPSAVITDDDITLSFSVAHNPDGGFCPSNNAVPVKVELAQPIGTRPLIDGQCADSKVTTTAFCRPNGVRWAGASNVPGTIQGQVIFIGGPVSRSLPPPSDAVVQIASPGTTKRTTADTNGRFSMSVPPGIYTVTATSSQYLFNGEKGLCQADEPQPVTAGSTTEVQVVCTIK